MCLYCELEHKIDIHKHLLCHITKTLKLIKIYLSKTEMLEIIWIIFI